mmetsp:Transcript_96035/g.188602  ORF Transcript_96035/g.188602 Transcript_96035/m.188602 type:complete len:200 (-) Transcript_96035:380-979(-)
MAIVYLPSTARSVIKSILSIGTVNAINSQLVRVVLVPESLEGHQILFDDVRGTSVVEVHRVGAGVAVSPAMPVQSAHPIVIIGSIHSAATLVVATARLSSQGNTTHTLLIPLVEHVLLSGGAPGRVQGDVVVLGSCGICKAVCGRRLKHVHTTSRAVDPVGIKCLERVSHLAELSGDLVSEATRYLPITAILSSKNAAA